MDAQAIVQDVWNKYVQKTPQRVKLLDSFMVFLVAVGVLQFAYCLIVGNFVRIHQLPRYSTSLAVADHHRMGWQTTRRNLPDGVLEANVKMGVVECVC